MRDLSSYMFTAKKHSYRTQEVYYNSINSNLANARIEGVNNLIKVIKRIAFGYRSFLHFKARILLISGQIKPSYNSI